MAPATLAR